MKIDPVQLQQVLTNLCLNARDGVGTITIETASMNSTESVRLSVRDTGKGVAEELKERLFEPFFTTKPAAEHTRPGLDLQRLPAEAPRPTERWLYGRGDAPARLRATAAVQAISEKVSEMLALRPTTRTL